jgi:apolipoprotein N-acyltransferase
VARIGGVYLLGLVVVAVGVLLAEILSRGGGEVALAGAAIVLAVGPGFLPLGLAGPQTGSYDLVGVQGNVPRDRFTGFGRGPAVADDAGIVTDHLRLTATLLGEEPPDLIVWPENAFDRDPRLNEDLFAQVRSLIAQIGSPMVLPAILEAGEHWTNSNLLLTPDGTIAERYDKVHLVPFGEYVPLGFARAIVPALDQEIPVDGMAGNRLVPFDVPGARVGTLICFESTYPRLARALVRKGTDLLVVTTNNASYGTSPASAQHLAISRMRAVEHGRAVVQAAISGISAFILPDGSLEQRTRLFEQALLRREGGLPLTRGQTPYTRYGSVVEIAMGVGAAAAVAAAFARRGKAV